MASLSKLDRGVETIQKVNLEKGFNYAFVGAD